MDIENVVAPVFNVQLFSLHDGPGIRACVFLMGCPLSCRWCANPESQSRDLQQMRDMSKCVGCGACASGVSVERRARECPGGAISISGEIMTARAVADICLRDKPFFDESGGGVTITGGEPLAHPEFTVALIDILKGEGVDCAVETSGYAASEIFESIAARADHMLIDVKHHDSAIHREFTGVSNEIILSNLARAKYLCKDALPRVPVIPGFNLDAADGIARAIKTAGYSRAQLLPFHQFGERKYALLGREYAFAGVAPLRDEDLSEYLRAFSDAGVEAFI